MSARQAGGRRGWWPRQRAAEEAVLAEWPSGGTSDPARGASGELDHVDQSLAEVAATPRGRAALQRRRPSAPPTNHPKRPPRLTGSKRAAAGRKPSPQLQARMEEAQGALMQSADLPPAQTGAQARRSKLAAALTTAGEGEEFLERLLERAGWQEELARFLAGAPARETSAASGIDSQLQYALQLAKQRIWSMAEEGRKWDASPAASSSSSTSNPPHPPPPPLDRETQRLLAQLYDKLAALAATHRPEGGAEGSAQQQGEAERELDQSLELLMLQGLDLLRAKALPRAKL